MKAFLPAGEEEGKEVTAADLKVGQMSLDSYFVSQIFKRKSLGHSPVASVPASSVHVLHGSSVRPDSPPGKIMSFLLKTAFLVDACNIQEKKHF